MNAQENAVTRVSVYNATLDMKPADLLAQMNKRIESLAKAEKVTKEELGELSREILVHLCVNKQTDVGVVNNLLAVLTPMNKRVAVLFFTHFIPWKYDDEAEVFTTMFAGEKKRDKRYDLARKFLDDVDANIWTWQKDNVEIKAPKPFDERIQNVVKQALKGIEATDGREGLDPISSADVIRAVLSAGVDVDEAMSALVNDKSEDENKTENEGQADAA